MTEADLIIKDLTDNLRWAMFYAEHGHEAMHPKETYAKDNNVAFSVAKARKSLEIGERYVNWIKAREKANENI